ncbi:MAG: hypothetical protein HFE78_01345 [Clostridiales bacterium]|nr:hypothetical protein [Clostridiales bacterium]
MNAKELKAEMIRNGYTTPGLANKIGISKKALYCKLSGESHFKLNEIYQVIGALKLNRDKIFAIFFEDQIS